MGPETDQGSVEGRSSESWESRASDSSQAGSHEAATVSLGTSLILCERWDPDPSLPAECATRDEGTSAGPIATVGRTTQAAWGPDADHQERASRGPSTTERMETSRQSGQHSSPSPIILTSRHPPRIFPSNDTTSATSERTRSILTVSQSIPSLFSATCTRL